MITIIGAGPVGCYLAYLLAKSNKVEVYEEHSEIGKPIQCAGILTNDIERFNFNLNKFVINKINKIRLYSKNNKVELKLNKPEYIIDREKFDKYLYEKAKSAGAKFYLNHKFLGVNKNRIILTKKAIKKDILVLANGPSGKKNYYGIQCRAKLKNDNVYETYFNVKDFFSWIIPENNKIVRIGMASKNKDIKPIFDNFLKLKKIKKIINYQSGLIPIFHEKISKDNIYHIGDAGGHVKATTAGGIVPGLISAEILADCINNNKDYNKKIKKLNKELKLHLLMRNMLDKFNQKDYNYLLKLVKQERIKNIIEKESREFPLKMVIKLLIYEPRFFRFLNKII